jgi:hypothetical protein
MTDDRPPYEVVTVEEVRRRYRLAGIKAEAVDFDENDLPDPMKHLIPLARVWGIGDDVLREDMVQAADRAALNELKAAVSAVKQDLRSWLSSPTEIARLSPAYLAFTNLRMVADEV